VKGNLIEQLEKGVVIGDGAMGTLLYERGLSLDRSCEELILTQPDLVRRVHEDYVDAGAQVIETNSFAANRLKLERHGLDAEVREINEKAARLAKEVAGSKDVWVAGSVGPLGRRLDEARAQGLDPEEIFAEQIGALLEGEADAIMLETFSDLEELLIALQVSQQLSAAPVICSMSFTEDGVTYQGVPIETAFEKLKKAGAKIVGANCCIGPRALKGIFQTKVPTSGNGMYHASFPNAGRPEFMEGRYMYLTTPDYFAQQSVDLARAGVRLLGGCCGTTPAHIRALREHLSQTDWQKEPVSIRVPELQPVPRAVTPKPTKAKHPTLLEVIQKRTLIVTEFDSPKTLNLDRMVEAAKALKTAGTDFITVADNSLAIMRMNCVVASHLVEKETGLRPIVHLACRDRNLIGTQSELMGMDALGLDHVLALTGDPSKVGDTPGATSVYDLNSISLLEGIRSMNQGRTFGGRDLKRSTNFVTGCAFNPNVKNLDVQVKRLERKVAAGVHFVMTQPVFDPKQVKMTFEATKQFGIPILVGVMPLLNARNTEFLHNEVPGIVIPENVRERMRNKEGEEGQKEGVAIAREIAAEVLKYFKGIYLITPLIHFQTTVELSTAVRSGKL
jgi:methionine synthase / methylenetetrahydrofolate reductase(NADPH)